MASLSRIKEFKISKKRNPVVSWVVRHALLIILSSIVVIELLAFVGITNWAYFAATINSARLNAVFEESRNEAFNNLVEMNYLALPVLLKQVQEEENIELFQTKMQLLENLGALDKLPPAVRVRYYFTYISRPQWENSVYAMKELAKIGPDAVPYICAILKTSFPFYRYSALNVLAAIADPSCSDTVLPFIRDPESIIRTKAFYALDACGALQKHRDELIGYICSDDFRSFDDRLKEYTIRILGKLQGPDLDEKMDAFLENGRPFETRIAAGYFALSNNMEQVAKVMDFAVDVYIDPAFRLEILNCLKTRLSDKKIQELLLGYLTKVDDGEDLQILTAGLGRFIAEQYFIVAELDEEFLSKLEGLLSSDIPEEVKWDVAIPLCYKNVKSSYKYLKDAIVKGSENPRHSRVSQLAAIALGESGSLEALQILVNLSNSGPEVARIRSIYWGLRVFGVNEGDWKLPKEALSVYPLLKKISENLSESTRIRGYAKKSIDELKSNPGQITGPKVVELNVDKLTFPIFTSSGKHINDIIRENLNYYDFPDY